MTRHPSTIFFLRGGEVKKDKHFWFTLQNNGFFDIPERKIQQVLKALLYIVFPPSLSEHTLIVLVIRIGG